MPEATGSPASLGWVDEVLAFWFDELTPEDWFRRNPDVDDRIRERFQDVYPQIAATDVAQVSREPRVAVAAVIALDQFPRNMFRGLAAAFATDERALSIAKSAVAAGFDRALSTNERLFLYLPYEHSEDAADQAEAVALISALGDARLTEFALAHQVIVDRFGRFPHRNAALGRPSTQEELEFLAGPGSSF